MSPTSLMVRRPARPIGRRAAFRVVRSGTPIALSLASAVSFMSQQLMSGEKDHRA